MMRTPWSADGTLTNSDATKSPVLSMLHYPVVVFLMLSLPWSAEGAVAGAFDLCNSKLVILMLSLPWSADEASAGPIAKEGLVLSMLHCPDSVSWCQACPGVLREQARAKLP